MAGVYETRRGRGHLLPEGEDVAIQGSPLYHILGQTFGLGAILLGDSLVLLPRVNLDGMFDHIQRYEATTLFGVPSMYRRILDHYRLSEYDLSSLK
jgi:long-chain acyl-CoA synthetase